jgi:hypothetical protein
VITVEEEVAGWYTLLRRVRRPEEQARAYERLAEAIPFLARWRILPMTYPAIMRYKTLKGLNLNVRKMDLRFAAIVLDNGHWSKKTGSSSAYGPRHGTPGGSPADAGIDPSHPRETTAWPGWLGSTPEGRRPQKCKPSAPGIPHPPPGFHATVSENAGKLVSRNLRDFQRIPNLSVEDWAS